MGKKAQEPMRIVYAKEPAFNVLRKATKDMTVAERVAFIEDLVSSIEESKTGSPVTQDTSPTATPGTSASEKANAIFKRMARFPTPMAPDAEHISKPCRKLVK